LKNDYELNNECVFPQKYPSVFFPGLLSPGALNSGLWLDEKIDALQHNVSVEVADYLERYPQTKHVDVYLNDINGIMRGKRLSVESMLSLEKGCYFPSVYSMDQKGKLPPRFMMSQTGYAFRSPVPCAPRHRIRSTTRRSC
jgi:hypothetical protein